MIMDAVLVEKQWPLTRLKAFLVSMIHDGAAGYFFLRAILWNVLLLKFLLAELVV